MNYTENYHLPQWEETDRIMRTDFNQMCVDMEAGIMDARGRAEEGDEAVKALTAKAQTAANNAQTTANSALAKANTAYSPSAQPYVVGTYVGNSEKLTITLGFRAKFLIVSSQYTKGGQYSYICPTGFVLAGDGVDVFGVTILDNGFTVETTYVDNIGSPPNVNDYNRTYVYIAFR